MDISRQLSGLLQNDTEYVVIADRGGCCGVPNTFLVINELLDLTSFDMHVYPKSKVNWIVFYAIIRHTVKFEKADGHCIFSLILHSSTPIDRVVDFYIANIKVFNWE